MAAKLFQFKHWYVVPILLFLGVFIWPEPIMAAGPERACAQGLVKQHNPLLHYASFKPGQKIPKWSLHVTFIGHSTFLIETPGGVSAATDYNGVHRPPYIPDFVTMNNLHSTHYTDILEPEIKFPLRGWHPNFGVARHDIRYRDLHVYNIPTNFFEMNGKKTNENSIFVFGASGLCLAHVGHLHHILTKHQKFRLENVDVLFLPIGGFATVSHEEALKIIEQVTPKIIIPMHYHYPGSFELFSKLMRPRGPVKMHNTSTIRLSKKTLPKKTEVHFLKPFDQTYP